MSSTGTYFFGNPFPNFSVKNDRVLDNLRVKQPHTFKLPPATLINPNLLDPAAPAAPVFPDDYFGSNDPATNATLRSGVAQAGALVYCPTPIVKPAGGLVHDGCFDGRNHLYFSDGDQWIPLANCLPKEAEFATLEPQYSQMYSDENQATDTETQNVWAKVNLFDTTPSSAGFTNSGPNDNITWEGPRTIVAKVVASVTWRMNRDQDGGSAILEGSVGIGVEGSDPTAELTQSGALNTDKTDTGSPPLPLPYPRNVTVSGLVTLAPGDAVNLQVIKNEDGGSPPDNIINILRANLSIVALL